MAAKKRRLLRPYEWFFLVIGMLMVLYVAVESFGGVLTSRTSEMTWLDHSSGPAKINTKPRASTERNVNAVLADLAEQFAEGDDAPSKRELRRKGLSEDEAEYYRDVKRQNDQQMSIEDWTNVVKTSYKTYRTVKSIFDMADGRKDESVSDNSITQILDDVELANRTFNNMENTFHIPRHHLEAFAARGGRALSDWATFVEQNKE